MFWVPWISCGQAHSPILLLDALIPRVAQRDEGKQVDENHLPVEERDSGEREQIRAVFQLSAVMT
jgi:hypothetical protein